MSTLLAAPPAPPRLAVTPGRVLAVLLALVVVASSALSISGLLVLQHRTTTASFPAVREVDADAGSGDVEVVADGGDAIRVERRESWSFRRPVRSETVVGGVLRLRHECAAWSGTCDLSYVVHVPSGTSVRVQAGSGDVRLQGVGAVDVQAGSGDVEGAGLRGDVQVRVGSGNVRLSAVTAERVSARTGSGELDLALTSAPSSVDLRSGSGDVTVLVPDDGRTAYAVSTRTGSGDVRARVRVDPSAARSITARTGSGDLTVAYGRG